ncbi:Asp-tRNA(Asn)/Glu-tRNA(Gln) amidotransferase subunit GatB [Mariniblastus fucicola]|uniref:Aspartyl/glutamyl-tRNA(Asn/Gln) amidotransferase subunit B n=1 Tax=Mariniblastus fucicola TaxID=980251 RepID=A0A5B9PED8_9BACT|nr:Asp-tRNA(Asn)/Glu-tRNA(Gln) amidotransferase subunit GatB [Mariniblastus fucicola]QEG23869.1 Aspartyl/glutamyl-tRNA(Asn/Gln) amidotransferase subunit B [Mariniblastus fucicola]
MTTIDREGLKFSDAKLIIGLEVHVQLKTESKLFCGCSTQFGSNPNTQTCPVCTGMPGTLPVLNEKALALSIKTGLALNCEIARYTKWDRKNYFYPDLPKGYQISQFDKPVCGEGFVEVKIPKSDEPARKIRLERAHLEEDAGKSVHDESGKGGVSKIDLNRTGTPLLEIVTKPDIRSAEEAKAFLTELKLILGYVDVSDCNMQEGSLRCDANVNLHFTDGEEAVATPIVEIKNLNSFRAAERAITHEARRQFKEFRETGETIDDAPKQTRGWDDSAQKTTPQREKELSADYRYFPDPDLIAVVISEQEIEDAKSSLGDLPAALRETLQSEYGLNDYDSDVIVSAGREMVDYFRAVADGSGKPGKPNGKMASNWVGQEVMRYLNENAATIEAYPVAADAMAELLARVTAGEVDQTRGKEVLAEMLASGCDVQEAFDKLGIVKVDSSDLDALCQQLIEENPAVIEEIKGGKVKAVGSLIGKARKINPNVNPGVLRESILKIIGL